MLTSTSSLDLISASAMSDRNFLMCLHCVEGIGPASLKRIADGLKVNQVSWTEFWQSKNLQRQLLSQLQFDNLQTWRRRWSVNGWCEYLATRHIWWLTCLDADYPQLLLHLDDKPWVLFGRSRQSINELRTSQQHNLPSYQTWTDFWRLVVSVVGTRQPTPYGQRVTTDLVSDLATSKITIVSGFMTGVDTLAHATALKAGGLTIGVLGYGFDFIVPRTHRRLFIEYLEDGMVFVTEFAPFVPPSVGTFPQRNRIVAGLAQATIVTEAAADSGSLITAKFAAEYGREVGAVPGSIHSRFSDGTRWLINQGAALVANGQDVLELLATSSPTLAQRIAAQKKQNFVEFAQSVTPNQQSTLVNSSSETNPDGAEQNLAQAKQILNLLTSQALTTDSLCRQTQLPMAQLLTNLSLLEISGQITRRGAEWWLT